MLEFRQLKLLMAFANGCLKVSIVDGKGYEISGGPDT